MFRYVIILLLTGCTRLEFHSKGKIPLHVSGHLLHHNEVKIEGKKEIYLWGHIPKVSRVDLDREFRKAGFQSVANISVTEYQSTLNLIKSILTLGLYTPMNYRAKAFGVKIDD